MKRKPVICIITGPPGAGKSAIAERLAHRFHNSAYINVDYIRAMIKESYVRPFPLTKESEKQITLSMRNACLLGRNFIKNGFNVFIDDVLVGKEKINYYKTQFKGNKLLIFLLFPRKAIIKNRDKARGKNAVGKRAIELYAIFEEMLEERSWYIIDNSNENLEQTVKKIRKIIIEG